MKVTNPCRYFTDGSNTKEFTYTPGDKPFQVTFRSKGVIPFNAMVFANSETHAIQIIEELANFRIEIGREYIHKVLKQDPDDYHGSVSNQDYRVNQAKQLIEAILDTEHKSGEYTLTITEAPKNQLYKISWASNDNLL